jgi:prepilin-type N-terminal cleavage/methylation domain-containing protein
VGSLREAGFTLVELLVVMIIISILSAIAVPAFLSQRKKSRDVATKSDIARVGKELAAYFVDGQQAQIVYTAPAAGSPARMEVRDAGGYSSGVIVLSEGTVQPGSAFQAHLNSPTLWCVALTNPKGDHKTYGFSGTNGLRAGGCS